ncbi:hypothetical protein M1D55_03100 [Cupriavidus sp. JZ107]
MSFARIASVSPAAWALPAAWHQLTIARRVSLEQPRQNASSASGANGARLSTIDFVVSRSDHGGGVET